ncbi:hypothetical protein HG537_0F01190 [Torulaspora globosa]|uniref:Cx9C motif-containing protein 4, mitochondrial n=1 Tax=Torulaspora globosa TaxID=48254 RepID=A0A7H9HUE6_9SACH|nr:hypothetical protein HG537_0F01190 [Torulaspora sp. CBS 2947]
MSLEGCQAEACAIQNCLLRNDYDESKCRTVVQELYRCCQRFYEQQGTAARSRCCPLPHVLRDKMRQDK